MKDARLVVQRKLTLHHLEVPASDYAKLRDFLNAANGHQQAVAVLIRK
ncbi:MAG: hypothetical protein IT162_13660 [Bryobacterales bacterium]|nr:hypothetical protein [Bryobacterales bacterium]